MRNKEVKTKKSKKSKMTKKAKIVIASVLAVIAFLTAGLFVLDSFAPASPKPYHKFALSTFTGSFDAEGLPSSYYQVQIQKEVGKNEAEYSCINTKVSTIESENIREIWVSFSDLYENELNIVLSTGWEGKSKFLSERTYSKSDVKNNENGWFKVYSSGGEGFKYNGSGVYGQIRFAFSANVKVREILVVAVDGRVGTVTVDHCSNGPKPIKGQNDDYAAVHGNKFTPSDVGNVCDEKSLYTQEIDGVQYMLKM